MQRTLALALALLATSCTPAPEPKEYDRDIATADVEAWTTELSNWGRWGDDDQLGTLNLITPAKRRAAARLVRTGISISLAHNVEKSKTPDNPLHFEHTMLSTGESGGQWCADNYSVSFHGYAHTHMDALCHIFYKGKMYNGYAQNEVGADGARKLGIHKIRDGIFSRGILVDIPRLKGKKFLEPGEAIYPEDLDAWEREAGVRIGSGDVVLISTGRWARRAETGPWSVDEKGAAGLHVSCAKWFHERDIAVLGSDAASDVLPSGIEGISHPVHLLMLNTMGVHIFDNLELEGLAAECAKQGRWEFLITVAPLAVEGGTGSPFNPIATF